MAEKEQRYEALIHIYHKELYRFAYWLCHDPHIAEDLVQDTFLRAWRSLDSLEDQRAAKPWLLTILRRENARRFERKQFDYSDIDNEAIIDKTCHSLDDEMDQTFIQRQISLLSNEYKEPLLLQVVMGCSGDEIAHILDLNKNTVMTRLFRARNQLKEALNRNDEQRKGASI